MLVLVVLRLVALALHSLLLVEGRALDLGLEIFVLILAKLSSTIPPSTIINRTSFVSFTPVIAPVPPAMGSFLLHYPCLPEALPWVVLLLPLPPTLTCFACQRPGHFQSQHEFPPFCLICRSEGHLTVGCMNRVKPPVVKQFGLGLPGYEFFGFDSALDVAVAVPCSNNVAIISVQSPNVTLQMLEDELHEWGLKGWDWKLQQISQSDFGDVFPSQESLKMLAKSTSFTLPLNQLVVSVKSAGDVVHSCGALVDSWVLMEDVPDLMHSRHVC